MSWQVVEAKWGDIRAAFHGFDPPKVAAMTPADVERLVDDPRVIRNRKKIEATIQNTERMIELDREHGGFARWLDSLGSFEETVAGLRGEFRFLGDNGAYLFLWTVDHPSPPHQEWFQAHRRPAPAASGPPRRLAVAKLIYSTIASLDGYVADRDGDFDWGVPGEEEHTFVNDLERPAGTYLYGRRMYEVLVDVGDARARRPAARSCATSPRSGGRPTRSSTRARCRRRPALAHGSSASSTPQRCGR